jgi:predicted alpha/beta hydrolase family esterase
MKKVFMIHGFGGEPNGGWRPWLMGKLAREGIWACALAMPMADSPKKEEWIKEITRMVGKPDEDTFLVGHSLGVPAILHYLESLPAGGISGAVLVSGPIHVLPGDRYRAIDHFMDTPFDFKKINNVCKKFSVIHGDNDVTVPFAHAEELSSNLFCNPISIPNGGHLNGSSGWYELPEALKALEEMIR